VGHDFLYFMGLNLSYRQIAQELELNQADVQEMTSELRQMVYLRRNPQQLTGEVEFDEVYLVAGHKGFSRTCSEDTILGFSIYA